MSPLLLAVIEATGGVSEGSADQTVSVWAARRESYASRLGGVRGMRRPRLVARAVAARIVCQSTEICASLRGTHDAG